MTHRPPNILIVEDEALIALDLQRQLEDMGYEKISTASSATLALALAECSQPDVVLLDINLNEKTDGIDLGQKLRDKYSPAIIYITAYADAATIGRAKHTDPSAYLMKPVRERELHSAVEIAAERANNEQKREKSRRLQEVMDQQVLMKDGFRTVSRLASGAAHELNNSLLVIEGNISLAQAHLPYNVEAAHLLEHALDACRRSANVIARLLEHSGQSRPAKQKIHLLEFLQKLISSIDGPEQDANVDLLAQEGDPTVLADVHQLRHILLELISFARENQPTANIEIEIGQEQGVPDGRARSHAMAANYAVVSVVAKGRAAPELKKKTDEAREHVQELLQERKRIGLSVVYGLAEQLGGYVTIDSSSEKVPGEKSMRIAVYLPLADELPAENSKHSVENPAHVNR